MINKELLTPEVGNEPQGNYSEVPQSPPEVPTNAPEASAGNMPSVEEEPVDGQVDPESLKNELLALLDLVKDKKTSSDNIIKINQQKLSENKDKLIPLIFQEMMNSGVDLTNLVSIRQYLEDLQEDNPDMYELFVSAMNSLMPGGDVFDNSALGEEGQQAISAEEEPVMEEGMGEGMEPQAMGMQEAQVPEGENSLSDRFKAVTERTKRFK